MTYYLDRSCDRLVYFGFLAIALVPGCFRGADVSEIICTESKYCPNGYTCIVPQGQQEGRCEKGMDSSGGEVAVPDGARTLDGMGAVDGIAVADGPLAFDVANSFDMVIDQGVGGVDQGSVGGSDVASMDVPIPDAPADFPLGTPDVADSSADDGRADFLVSDSASKPGGATCQSGAECSSTYCVDGVCCDSSCTGQCQACAETNKVGTCTIISGAPRGTRAACTATQATCAGQCSGTSPNQCSFPGSEKVCSSATCSGDQAMKPASVCNGAGACTTSSVVPCSTGSYCASGSCTNQIANGGTCQSNNQCTSGNCSSSTCCAAGKTGCEGLCVSLNNDSANCGSCGRKCATGSSCTGSSCYLDDGQACTTGTQCFSGICSTFYMDTDRDGYGLTSTTISRCGTTVPTGYATQGGDCCDSDETAHPGQTNTYPSANKCGSFDYNCDGNPTPKSNGPTDCGTLRCDENCNRIEGREGSCTCGGDAPCTIYSVAACGRPYYYSYEYCYKINESCNVGGNGAEAGTQECN
jgi:hypothetical protein